MHAKLSNYHQSPRKVRLLADLVRGKRVEQAVTELRFITKRASDPVVKLIQSAVANALDQNKKLKKENLYVKEIAVNKGIVFKRFRPRAHGRAFPIRRRTSHVSVILGEKA